ncbi:hypothetical protein LSM04_005009 [Trypanosoma melophagium]|uniref:uncharacterized protein n=1 Tax=Trypanosoma melophagium TaxID=715481 RepID=UPI003519DFED|nr:hypothetical protein LSM04_005009 [Trypanosoma melophagium]
MSAICGGVESTSNGVVTPSSSTADVELSSWEFLRSDTRPRKLGSTQNETQYVLDITYLNFPARKHQQQQAEAYASIHPNSAGVPRTLLDYLLQGIPAAGHKRRDVRGSVINNTESGDVLLGSLLLPPEPVIRPGTQYMERRRRRYSAGEEEEDDYKRINVQLKKQEEDREEERVMTVPLLRRHDGRLLL